MKIKDVCRETGLTERTVRFYAEQGLISPKTSWVNGRNYLDFSARDIEELSELAALRRAQFSISEIVIMKREPRQIPELLELKQAQLTAASEEAAGYAEKLRSLPVSPVWDISRLARELERGGDEAERGAPNFGRFDPETRGQRDEAYEQFLISNSRRERRRGLILRAAGALILIAISVLITLFAAGVLPAERSIPDYGFEDTLSEAMSEEAYRSADFVHAWVEHSDYRYTAGGIDGITGSATALYENDEDSFTIETRRLNTMECTILEELEIPLLTLRGDPDTPESKLEGFLPGENPGEYWGVFVESETLTEDALRDICRQLQLRLPDGTTTGMNIA